ncbi:MAG: hypothetical protein AB7E49_02330 [Campylobacterales bacterium]
MSYETLKRFQPAEADFVLGKNYLSLAAQATSQSPAALRDKLLLRLNNRLEGSAQENGFYDFLIELAALTFVVHKWGLLLFHLDNQMYGDWILSIEVEGEPAILTLQNRLLALKTLYGERTLFLAGAQNKSAIAEILFSLSDQKTALEILQAPQDEERFDGNHVSFNADRAAAQCGEILWIKAEFERYKARLLELQQLFADSFARPEGMVDQPS